MPDPAPSLAAQRYRMLINQLADELGKPRPNGWQASVARRLGVSRSYISQIVTGRRVKVGAKAIESAELTLGLRPAFFSTPASERPSYKDFLGRSLATGLGPAPVSRLQNDLCRHLPAVRTFQRARTVEAARDLQRRLWSVPWVQLLRIASADDGGDVDVVATTEALCREITRLCAAPADPDDDG